MHRVKYDRAAASIEFSDALQPECAERGTMALASLLHWPIDDRPVDEVLAERKTAET